MTAIRSYSYKPKFHLAVLALCVFASCAMVGGYATMFEDREVVISSLIKLGEGGSKLYFILLALGSLVMVVQAIMAIRASLMPDRCIVLTEGQLSIPASLYASGTKDIALADIAGLSLQAERRWRILRIRHGADETRATQRFFENRAQFEDFVVQLQAAIRR
ncbi:MAG: hypothetical protein IE933_01555 [Sphingomonadales bacterium]|nr:hypothetical protein [Sphingomonadales bacterium]MBD3771956.1 hypothetical protein [Paracoccaceae bacterium]